MANLIAVEVSNLVAAEGRDQSPILKRFDEFPQFRFHATTKRFDTPLELVASKYNLLVLETGRTRPSEFGMDFIRSSMPICWEWLRSENRWPTWRELAFDDWWHEPVVASESRWNDSEPRRQRRYVYSRASLVKAVRNSRGAHSRSALREDEMPLNELNAFSMGMTYSGPLAQGEVVRYCYEVLPSQAATRQIAEELLSSISALDRRFDFEARAVASTAE